jgi:predicted lipoprotein
MLYLGKEHSHTSNFDRINKLETPKLDAIPSRKNNHGLEAIPVQSIASNGLSALAFRIHNEGKDPLSLSEKEFYKRGDLALSLEKTELEAGESTTLFIITNA